MPKVSCVCASVLVMILAVGCSRPAPPPPVDDTNGRPGAPLAPAPEPAKAGMTTGTKVVLLAGAAALYYLYKHHQSASAPEGQYYLSKNGRVYYRDAEHRAHWVTAPPEGIKVPESEAHDYRQFEGYAGNSNGRDLAGLTDQ